MDRAAVLGQKIPRNFFNRDNSCFIDATVQILLRTDAVANHLRQPGRGPAHHLLQEVFNELQKPYSIPYEPTKLLQYAWSQLTCERYRQNDPGHFLGLLLDRLKEEEGNDPLEMKISSSQHDSLCDQRNRIIMKNVILIHASWASNVQAGMEEALSETLAQLGCCGHNSAPTFDIAPKAVTLNIDYTDPDKIPGKYTVTKKRMSVNENITIDVRGKPLMYKITGIVFLRQASRYRGAHYISYSRQNKTAWYGFDDLSDVTVGFAFPPDICPLLPTILIYEQKDEW